MLFKGALWIAAAGLLVAQNPGQVPPGQYPPGQYPPGQYPQQGPSIPFPKRHKKDPAAKDDSPKKDAPIKTSGVLREVGDKSLVLVATDSRIITYKLTGDTKFIDAAGKEIKLADLTIGLKADIESKATDDGQFVALRVINGGPPPPPPPTIHDADDGGAPVLKRGIPPPTIHDAGERAGDDDGPPPTLKRGVPSPQQQTLASSAPPPAERVREVAPPPEQEPKPRDKPAGAHMLLLEKARENTLSFTEGLPNYVCQQFTTRYLSQAHRAADWKAQDVVSAEVVYLDGKETYRNVVVNGRKGGDPEKNGAWSTGEFGTLLRDLFDGSTSAHFHFARDARLGSHSAKMFDFEVTRQHSHWQILASAQTVYPAYKGTIWIDSESARVIRVETQAVDIPKEFPFNSAESAVDFEPVAIGVARFLLPAHAESLICQRDPAVCSRNSIDFRNYHKFAGESTIQFEK